MKPTIEQLQERMKDAKDYVQATQNRSHEASLKQRAAEERLAEVQKFIDAITEQQDYAHQQPV